MFKENGERGNDGKGKEDIEWIVDIEWRGLEGREQTPMIEELEQINNGINLLKTRPTQT